jgi:hypothetical protein
MATQGEKTIIIFIGVLFILGGIIASQYSENETILGFTYGTINPYEPYVLPLIMFGVIVCVIGLALPVSKVEAPTGRITYAPPQRFCIHCGAQITADSNYCPKCGKSQR